MIDPSTVRATLARLVAERGESLSSLSRRIERNAAYLHQFIHRGTPAALGETERLTLAKHFRIDERLLGARDPWTPADDG